MPYNGAGDLRSDLHFANRPLGGKPIGLPAQLTYTPHKTSLIQHDLVGLSQLV